jgi:hypothetical protein
MNFKTATDGLFDRIDHAELADALGVSVATIRQARLSPDANAFRQPPERWQAAVIRLAEQRAAHYKRLANTLRRNGDAPK